MPCTEGPPLSQKRRVVRVCEPLPFVLAALGPHPLIKTSVRGVLSPHVLESPLHKGL